MQLSAQTLGVVASPAIIGIPINNPAPQADLAIEALTVKSVGNNQYQVTATLENLPPVVLHQANVVTIGRGIGPVSPPGVTYPGGGVLKITSTDGGRFIDQLPNGIVIDTPHPTFVLASMPIPSLAPGQTIQLSTIATGRALFTASAVPAVDASGNPLPFPETNSANDSRTVDNLVPHTFYITTATLSQFATLTTAIQETQIVLDTQHSSISIPGFLNKQFTIPAQSVGIGPFTAKYYVDNLVSTGASLSYENGGLAITVKFADNAHALHTTAWFAPDISVKNLQVTLFLPLSYSASGQYFNFGTPTVSVTGNWNANGLLGSAFDLLLPNINQKMASGLTTEITPVLGDMAFSLNQHIQSLIPGGRIVSTLIETNDMFINVETQS